MKHITEIAEEQFAEAEKGKKKSEKIEEVTIRFSGDSGDGMQLTGSQFTSTTAIFGNDLSTLPDFPAEIRAPAGTVAGVSGYQIHFSSKDIHTPGDRPEVLVAMNPAALKANLKDVVQRGVLILNEDTFTEKNLEKVGYTSNPAEDDSLSSYRVISVPISKLTREALKECDVSDKDKDRSKNMFALGLTYWMFDRPLEPTISWVNKKFEGKENIIDANVKALKAGYNYGNITERMPVYFQIHKAKLKEGTYRNITGNQALSLGLVAAASITDTPLFLGSYPITPASDILHELSKHKNFRVRTFQAEDEIAAMAATVGAAYAGYLAVTTTSGPGFALKSEALNLAVMTELPLVVINVQRAGPSTGMPTKVEQADLMQALYGRNGESPTVLLAPSTPTDCFEMAIEALRIATEFMVPVVLLSDGFLANGSAPWRLPSEKDLPKFKLVHDSNPDGYNAYNRKENLARPWVKPGTKDMEHRIGGIEKQQITGNVSYDPDNHQRMTEIREQKVANVAKTIGELEVEGSEDAEILLLGWGSTYGAITDARLELEDEGYSVAQTHLKYINPLPENTEKILSSYKEVYTVEINRGQINQYLRGRFAIPLKKITKVKGQPFTTMEIVDEVKEQSELIS